MQVSNYLKNSGFSGVVTVTGGGTQLLQKSVFFPLHRRGFKNKRNKILSLSVFWAEKCPSELFYGTVTIFTIRQPISLCYSSAFLMLKRIDSACWKPKN